MIKAKGRPLESTSLLEKKIVLHRLGKCDCWRMQVWKKKRKSSEAQENVTFGILKKSDVGKEIIKKLKNNILIKN